MTHPRRVLRIAVASGAACVAALAAGLATDYGDAVFFPAAFASGLVAYTAFFRWVSLLNHTASRLYWTLERARQVLAYEGDPGPFPRQ
jgi:hypothetical protein